MKTLQNRHDLTVGQWAKIEPVITKMVDNWGGSNASDPRYYFRINFLLHFYLGINYYL
ncbi:MAG: hypothetical protein LBI42_10880 [Chitinispirillales bacterium]|jgi:hypothetical protein|nr:hypothetical protein [Chitinispirillales bacterium]